MHKLYKCERCNGENSLEFMDNGLCMYCIEYIRDMEIADREWQRQIITREMALDAGDPELEGHEW